MRRISNFLVLLPLSKQTTEFRNHILKRQINKSLITKKDWLFGGKTRAGTVGTFSCKAAETDWGGQQEGQPFKTLGPHISPIVVNWTTQVHNKTDVVALIIHSFIFEDGLDILLLIFSTPLTTPIVSLSFSPPPPPHFLSILHIYPPFKTTCLSSSVYLYYCYFPTMQDR